MAWRVGIDEAGYGPNLGPFVMSAAACRVPDEHSQTDLWNLFKNWVRHHKEKDPNRLAIDDSKLIYSTAKGLADLESSVLPLLHTNFKPAAQLLTWINALAPNSQLEKEAWFHGQTPVPFANPADKILSQSCRLAEGCKQQGAQWGLFQSAVVCTPRFNLWVDRYGSKGAVLGHCLADLMQACLKLTPEPMYVAVDKHGGRNNYSAILQHAFEGSHVWAKEESAQKSTYDVKGLDRDIEVTFLPKADSTHLVAAAASMLSKYLRELLMEEFNQFWQKEIPGLQPTAGYPVDALRFAKEIEPARARMGICMDDLWRKK